MAIFNRGISSRLFLVAGLAVAGLIAVTVLGLVTLHSNLYQSRLDELRRIEETAASLAQSSFEKARRGEITMDEAKARAADEIGRLRFDDNNYVFVMTTKGLMIVHPSDKMRGVSGLEMKDADGVFIFREMVDLAAARGAGTVAYRWPKPGASEAVPKISHVGSFKEWGWIVGTGMWVDDVEAQFRAVALRSGLLSLVFGGAIGLIAFLVVRSVTRPLAAIRQAMVDLGHGHLDVAVDTTRKDELGDMAEAVMVFRRQEVERRELTAATSSAAEAKRVREQAIDRLVGDFRRRATDMLGAVDAEMRAMTATATDLGRNAATTSRRSDDAADASREASENVVTVSAAGEELMHSIDEIARQVSRTTDVVAEAAKVSRETNVTVGDLAQAAGRIGAVVGLIRDIAEQTNLLALNATIEAARAGESGRGFAVVAAEVKTLAGQTAKATEEISAQIGAIQGTTGAAVEAIGRIVDTMGEVDTFTSAIAAAVEEQGASTAEIARNVSLAAERTRNVAENIGGVSAAAGETTRAAGEMTGAAGRVAATAEDLRAVVDRFLADVAAA
jgi:methyl-accepting chemotaxis protein